MKQRPDYRTLGQLKEFIEFLAEEYGEGTYVNFNVDCNETASAEIRKVEGFTVIDVERG